MRKHFTKKKIGLVIIIILVVMQAFRIDKTILPVDASKDFISVTAANTEVANLLKIACYDCHSNQPVYPWYTNIAPVSWWIKHHINEGSHHLNFSIWGEYKDKRKHHKLEECIEMVEEGEMPMNSYTWMHKEAQLTDTQKQLLVEWFKGLKDQIQLPQEEEKH